MFSGTRRLTRNTLIFTAIFTFFSMPVGAQQAASKGLTPQQQRMAECNKSSTGKKGDERKAYMRSCLSAETPSAKKPLSSSQQRMKDCNAQAREQVLSGDKRKAFMRSCLSNKP